MKQKTCRFDIDFDLRTPNMFADVFIMSAESMRIEISRAPMSPHDRDESFLLLNDLIGIVQRWYATIRDSMHAEVVEDWDFHLHYLKQPRKTSV